MRLRIPNDWTPRRYQFPLWDYLQRGGRRAIEIAHRRWGKDDVALHWAACASVDRVGTYWHMLPEASQARKAIWDAVDPHKGVRRIDIAFPREMRALTRENEMMIRFHNGSTWQVVGSDNYNSLVGSPPIGLVSSEHAIARPQAWAYLRPILLENQGWALFITTARGKNHAYDMLRTAQADPEWFAEVSPATRTGRFTPEQLEKERRGYHSDYGPDHGEALFKQEYLCDFEAAIPGAYYTRELADARATGRIGDFPWIAELPVFVGGDLGRTDELALWFWQMPGGRPRFIDYFEATGKDVESTVEVLRAKPYRYADPPLWLPHDAKPETYGAPRSVQRQFKDLGFRSRIVPGKDVQDGIQAARATLRVCEIDADNCADGLEALGAYRRLWDDDKHTFDAKPLHDWASHGADGFRYCSIAWREDMKPGVVPVPQFPVSATHAPTFDQLRNMVRERRIGRDI